MQDITAPAREEALVPAPPNTSQPRKQRIGAVALGVSALGLGLAGGMNVHRLMDLD